MVQFTLDRYFPLLTEIFFQVGASRFHQLWNFIFLIEILLRLSSIISLLMQCITPVNERNSEQGVESNCKASSERSFSVNKYCTTLNSSSDARFKKGVPVTDSDNEVVEMQNHKLFCMQCNLYKLTKSYFNYFFLKLQLTKS